jgi:predicted phosphodiesterase
MERTRKNNKQVSLILCSDFHLREDTPVCFTGDFQKEQWDSVKFIKDLQEKYDCPVVHAGDLFHHWKASPWLLSKTMENLPYKFYTIFGQHDLPQHNWELRDKSGINTLFTSGHIKLLFGCNYGQSPENMIEDSLITLDTAKYKKRILVWHHMTYINPPFPGATGGNAIAILKKYPQYGLIVTGDNHCSFYTEHEGRILVNPGNLTRQVADQAEFQPRVALWYAETNTIEWVNIPIQKDVISREHITHKEERDERIDAFISKLDTDFKAELSFEDNLEMFFQQNEIRDSVREIIYKSLD